MNTASLFDIPPMADSVFLDNVTLSGASRALKGDYEQQLPEHCHPMLPGVVLAHDLHSLGTFIECIVIHEHFYVNEKFAMTWAHDDGPLAESLGLFTAVTWPDQFQNDLEKQLRTHALDLRAWRKKTYKTRKESPMTEFADHLYRITHRSRPFIYGDHAYADPYVSEYEPMMDGVDPYMKLALGASFYIACSQVIGAPYRPGPFRSLLLRSVLASTLAERPQPSGQEIAWRLMETSRNDVVQEVFHEVFDFNSIDIVLPSLFGLVLKESQSSSDVVRIALQVRDSDEAQAFRQWSGRFGRLIQEGDLTAIGDALRELRTVTEVFKRRHSLETLEDVSIQLGWGPVKISIPLPFVLPEKVRTRLTPRVPRHLWFMDDMQQRISLLPRDAAEIRRVLGDRFPDGALDWSYFED